MHAQLHRKTVSTEKGYVKNVPLLHNTVLIAAKQNELTNISYRLISILLYLLVSCCI